MALKPVSAFLAPFVRSPYNYDAAALSDETGLDCSCDGAGRTKQSFSEEADINTLIRRFGIDGQIPQGVRMPSFGDFRGVGSYQDAIHAVMLADASFQAMPAHVRSRFGNDPAAFVAFCDDDANREEAVRLGLVPAPVPAPVASPEAPVMPLDKPQGSSV
ncbi:MAG: internal scaffolding protein [Microvirus sp.]|nr:MAG: internal scaffolding protein [Microvirus sp.]